MKTSERRLQLLVVLLAGLFLSCAPAAWSQSCGKCDSRVNTRSNPDIQVAQERIDSPRSHPDIPDIKEEKKRDRKDSTPSDHGIGGVYETFALFLFPSDQWTAENHNDIAVLRQAFEHFGDAIGARHLAVWLYEDDLKKRIDTDRARQYCAKFGCPDDTGPHIILTSVNPDRWQRNQDEVLRLSLKGIQAERASEVLAVLEKDLVNYRARHQLPDRVEWTLLYEILRDSIQTRNLKDVVLAFLKP